MPHAAYSCAVARASARTRRAASRRQSAVPGGSRPDVAVVRRARVRVRVRVRACMNSRARARVRAREWHACVCECAYAVVLVLHATTPLIGCDVRGSRTRCAAVGCPPLSPSERRRRLSAGAKCVRVCVCLVVVGGGGVGGMCVHALAVAGACRCVSACTSARTSARMLPFHHARDAWMFSRTRCSRCANECLSCSRINERGAATRSTASWPLEGRRRRLSDWAVSACSVLLCLKYVREVVDVAIFACVIRTLSPTRTLRWSGLRRGHFARVHAGGGVLLLAAAATAAVAAAQAAAAAAAGHRTQTATAMTCAVVGVYVFGWRGSPEAYALFVCSCCGVFACAGASLGIRLVYTEFRSLPHTRKMQQLRRLIFALQAILKRLRSLIESATRATAFGTCVCNSCAHTCCQP
jgi:hypothetical protein